MRAEVKDRYCQGMILDSRARELRVGDGISMWEETLHTLRYLNARPLPTLCPEGYHRNRYC